MATGKKIQVVIGSIDSKVVSGENVFKDLMQARQIIYELSNKSNKPNAFLRTAIYLIFFLINRGTEFSSVKTKKETLVRIEDRMWVFLRKCLENLEGEVTSESLMFSFFWREFIDYFAQFRPLINWAELNSYFLSTFQNSTLDGIKAISFQGIAKTSSWMTVTYQSNNLAAQRDEAILKDILRDSTKMEPVLTLSNVNGVRAKYEVEFKLNRLSIQTDAIEELVTCYRAYQEANVPVNEEEVHKELLRQLKYSGEEVIERFNLESILKILKEDGLERPLSLSVLEDGNYSLDCPWSSLMLETLSIYLYGYSFTMEENNKISVLKFGATAMDSFLAESLKELSLKELIQYIDS